VKNLTPWQCRMLDEFCENKSILITSANKSLGPVGIETERYIKLELEHLVDTSTYEVLTEHDAH
jgi:hypothetical protein